MRRQRRPYRELDIVSITANVGREVSRDDRGRRSPQEAAQLTNLAFGEGELIAKVAAEFLGNEDHQFVMCQHILEKFGTHAGPADRSSDQYRGIENNLHERSRMRNTSSCRSQSTREFSP
jgi:hypothetical protein